MPRNVVDIFNEARELPADKREAYIVGACGKDAALRADVESLLRANGQAGGFMARPTGDNGDASMLSMHFEAASEGVANEQAGKQIGPYKLLEKIGEGGFGTVWMAEQREPVRRRVAIKLIKLGMDTKQVIARFEAERQALAMMDHPNIAKVLDAGSTEAGRPYFVMEYIRGIPILEYCDQELLDTKARLALFTDVCHAIQHAHHKGIIHRDIKPSNVLVTMHDGVPVPKVIDFGIAKATNSELTTKTLFTEHRQMIGTPAYMSPEQAEMSALDIDTRSDIYSLGVLLYELLTGTTPFDVYDLRVKGYEEMLRIIREDEPHKPSTRVSTLGEDGAQAAKHRRAHDPKRLSGILRGDLDWIVMKCLEKDRTRRYDTANGLAADVQRHLHDEPVTAGAPSTAYKLRKFVRRNRGKVVAASLVAGTLILGVIGTTGGMLWANTERDRASDAKAKADLAAASESVAKVAAQQSAEKAGVAAQRAKAAKEEEAAARKRAETISEFMVTALRSSDAQNAGGRQDMTILAAMDQAIADVDSGRFKDDPATEAGLKSTIGVILRNNGRLQQAETLLTQVLETRRQLSKADSPELSWAMSELASTQNQLGRKEEARKLMLAVLDMDERLFHSDHAAIATDLSNLAGVMPPAEAEPLFRRAIEMRRRLSKGDSADLATHLGNLANVLLEMGRAAEAEPLHAEALAMCQRVHEGDHPSVAQDLDNLGKARHSLGRRAEGVELLTQALAMRKRLFKGPHPDVAIGLNNLAAFLMEEGRLAEAEPLYAEALEMRQRLFEGDNWDLALSISTHAGVLQQQGRLEEAESLYARALAMRQRLARGDASGVADSLSRLARVRLELDRPAEAEPLCVEALEMCRRLYRADHMDVATSLSELGFARAAQGRSAEAEPLLMQAKEMFRRLEPSDSPQTAKALDNLGKALQRVGRPADAEALLAQALAMRERLYEGDHADLAKGLNNLAGAQAALRRFAEAEATQRRSLEMCQRLFRGDHPNLAAALDSLAILLRDMGRPAQAEPFELQAVEMYQRFFKGDHPRLALALYSLGSIREAAGRLVEAVPPYEAAMQMDRRRLPARHDDLLACVVTLARAYYQIGSFDKAIPLFEEALGAYEAKLGRQHPQTLLTIGNLGANYAVAGRFVEATPLLEEAWKHSKQNPQLAFVGPHLLSAWSTVANPRNPDDARKIVALARDLIGNARHTMPPGGPDLAGLLAHCGGALLTVEVWDEAEALLRECLAIREKVQPDEWKTFNTKSLLGRALFGQKKLAEAEPLLLAGYRGMKEREAIIPPQGATRIPEALERLVKLYEAKGDAAEAASWRAKLDAARATESRPSTRENKR